LLYYCGLCRYKYNGISTIVIDDITKWIAYNAIRSISGLSAFFLEILAGLIVGKNQDSRIGIDNDTNT